LVRTEHGEHLAQWESMPLPLACLGIGLRTRDHGQWQRGITFLETMFSLAIAYGLAQRRERTGEDLDPRELEGYLTAASLGQRLELIQRLPTGWDLTARSESFVDLVRDVLGPADLPKRKAPSVAQALSAIVTGRNILAHPQNSPMHESQVLERVLGGAEVLAGLNQLFSLRLLRCDGFGATADGRPGVVCSAFMGRAVAPYRHKEVLDVPAVRAVGQMFLFDPHTGWALDLHPFVQCDGDEVFILSAIDKGRARYWNPLTGGRLHGAPTEGPTTPRRLTPPESSNGVAATMVRRRTSLRKVLALAGTLSVLLGSVLLLSRSSGEEASAAPIGPAPASSTPAAVAPRSSTPPKVSADPILRQLFGLQVDFGAPVASVEPGTTGRLPARCRGRLNEPLPGEPWVAFDLPTADIPGQQRTAALVDRESGLFEVDVYTSADVAPLAAWVQRRMGEEPTAVADDRSWFRWRWGERQINVARNRNGNTMLIAFHDARKQAFAARRRALCAIE